MTEETAPKKERAKPSGPRNYIATVEGKEFFVKLDDVRVANKHDQDRAIDGLVPRGKVVDAKAAQP